MAIYDIAAAQRPIEPVSAFLDARSQGLRDNVTRNAATQQEQQIAQHEQEAPLRESNQQAQISGNDRQVEKDKWDTVLDKMNAGNELLLKGAGTQAQWETTSKQLVEMFPDMEDKITGDLTIDQTLIDHATGSLTGWQNDAKKMQTLEANWKNETDPEKRVKSKAEFEAYSKYIELKHKAENAELETKGMAAERERAEINKIDRVTTAGVGRSSAPERIAKTIQTLAMQFEEQDGYLGTEDSIELANALNNSNYTKVRTANTPDGATVTYKERDFPDSLKAVAKYVLGDDYGNDKTRGKGVETLSQREARQEANRVNGLIDNDASKAIDFINGDGGESGKAMFSGLDQSFFGLYSSARTPIQAGLEWSSQKADAYMTKKQHLDDIRNRLIAHARRITKEGGNASDKDMARLESLVGVGAFSTKSSALQALRDFKEMAADIQQSYENQRKGDKEPVASWDDLP